MVCDSVFFCELVECSVGQNLLQAFVYFIAELGISFFESDRIFLRVQVLVEDFVSFSAASS